MKSKFELYVANGVMDYWVVDNNNKSIHQFFLQNEKYQLLKIYFDDDIIASKLFARLKINVGKIFE